MAVRFQLRKIGGAHCIAIEDDLTYPMVRPVYVTVRFWLVKMMMYHCRIKLDSLPPPSSPLQHYISGMAAGLGQTTYTLHGELPP
jgi:hypothetical protein